MFLHQSKILHFTSIQNFQIFKMGVLVITQEL